MNTSDELDQLILLNKSRRARISKEYDEYRRKVRELQINLTEIDDLINKYEDERSKIEQPIVKKKIPSLKTKVSPPPTQPVPLSTLLEEFEEEYELTPEEIELKRELKGKNRDSPVSESEQDEEEEEEEELSEEDQLAMLVAKDLELIKETYPESKTQQDKKKNQKIVPKKKSPPKNLTLPKFPVPYRTLNLGANADSEYSVSPVKEENQMCTNCGRYGFHQGWNEPREDLKPLFNEKDNCRCRSCRQACPKPGKGTPEEDMKKVQEELKKKHEQRKKQDKQIWIDYNKQLSVKDKKDEAGKSN